MKSKIFVLHSLAYLSIVSNKQVVLEMMYDNNDDNVVQRLLVRTMMIMGPYKCLKVKPHRQLPKK
jgi:hypothetical protein